MIDEEDGPQLVACIVERRGRFLVAQPFFDDGQQLALGRRSGQAVEAGELVVVEHAGGSARVVERLGSPDHVGHVLRALLLERGLAREWPEAARREARRVAREHEPDGERADLLELEAITIDPPTARDFDDAISIEPDGDGVRAWVHIADVASYVKPGGALDAEAGRRTCSVYVPGSVEPMLPLELSADACSLRPGEVRRVVSLELRVGADGKPGAPRVRRALIRSRARLTYDEAHEVLEGSRRHPNGDLLARADALARDLRARRHARGAFTLGRARALVRGRRRRASWARSWDEEPRAHALVEELMLLANEAVGGLLARAKRPALYRVHEHPKHEALLALADRLTALGLPVVPLPERAERPRGLARGRPAGGAARADRARSARPRARPFGALLLRTLQLARYDPVNIGHAALAVAGLRPLHVADPPLSRHRRAPRGLRARRPGRGGAEGPRPARGRAALLAARARGGRCRASRRRDLPGVPAPGHAAQRAAGTRASTASSRASSVPGCSCASARSSRASCPRGASTRASASTSTSTASRSSAAARAGASASATSSPSS